MPEYLLKAIISALIAKNAREYSVDPRYVAAIVYQESVQGSDSLADAIAAYRFESGFFATYVENKPLTGFVPKAGIHVESERYARAASFGLMQIMGATARENGLQTRYISSLFFPWINIKIGTKYFAKLLADSGGDYYIASRRYNGSLSNPKTREYADSIRQHVEQKRYKAVLI